MTDQPDPPLASLWQSRYRAPPADAPADALAAATATVLGLLTHRSVRAYRPDPPPPGALDLALAAAQSASTSSNLQAWSVVAIADAPRRDRLAALAGNQAHIRQAPLFLAWLADLSRLHRLGAAHNRPTAGLDYLEMFLVAVIDAALAAQNAAAAFESMGLGTVYIGGLRNHPEQVAAELGLPPRVLAVFGMCVGYPDPARPADIKPRLPQAAVLHREQYDAGAEDAAVAAYDERADAFQREQGLPARAWSDAMARRVAGPEALMGRHVLREVLARMGFPLR